MKYSEKMKDKLNDLLVMNLEVENIYNKISRKVDDDKLKTFFKERALERNEFCEELRNEVRYLGEISETSQTLTKDFYKTLMNLKNSILLKDENSLFDEVHALKKLNVDAYNKVLMERNVSLKLCKKLVKQRDSIQSAMHLLKRETVLAA
jgi:uncharacterized protein (TIGR02284 family)